MRKALFILILASFLANSVNITVLRASEITLPAPGTMVHLSPAVNPPMLKGIKVHPDNPLKFDFVLDKGMSSPNVQDVIPAKAGIQQQEQLKAESAKLIKYFLAALTTPEKDIWVNLSPYEKDRIVPDSFGQTEMGRDLLAQDYLLKQITASLVYPEGDIGREFWKRVYEEANRQSVIASEAKQSINTFNKVWIVPNKAVVYENAKAGTAYVVESSLSVLTEQDYLATNLSSPNVLIGDPATSKIVRDIVIPQLTKEVNEGANFASLRQVYNSLILAAWYKKKIKESILSQVYVDKNKVEGISTDDRQEKQQIYERYLQAFKKGAYNYIKEEQDALSGKMIPRKYFSGGFSAANFIENGISYSTVPPTVTPPNLAMVSANIDAAMKSTDLPKVEEGKDVVFSPSGFQEIFVGGARIWSEFKENVGEAKEWPEPTKTISVGSEVFVLVKKLYGLSHQVFTLQKSEFEKLAAINGWSNLPQVDPENDVVFSPIGFQEVIVGGIKIWKPFKESVGEATEWPESTKSIEVGDKTFVLVKKRNSSKQVFTLSKSEFEKLAAMNGWVIHNDLPQVDPENDVVFSTLSFGETLVGGASIWEKYKEDVGEATKWPESTKSIEVGDKTFELIKKMNGMSHPVFTLPQSEFDKLAAMKGWAKKSNLSQVDPENDVVFSPAGFGEALVGGEKILISIKKDVGEASQWPELTKSMHLGNEKFELVKKLNTSRHVFTLSKSEFDKLAAMKGWVKNSILPNVDPENDVVFSLRGFMEILVGGSSIWTEYKKIVGEAIEWPDPTKPINVGNEAFVLVKKMKGTKQVFTLSKSEFEKLSAMKGWLKHSNLPNVDPENDVVFSTLGFAEALMGGQNIWDKYKDDVGEAKEWPEPTKSINVGNETFVLVKKINGKHHQIFTLSKNEFERLAAIKGWVKNSNLPHVDPENDVVFAPIGFQEVLVGGISIWTEYKKIVGEATKWPDPIKPINVGNEAFALVKKKNGTKQVFTLSKSEFDKLAAMKGWIKNSNLPSVDPENDVVFSPAGFQNVLVGGESIWLQYKKVVGEAKEWPEPTKSISVGNKEFVLVKKMKASSQVFTLSKSEFDMMSAINGWIKSSNLPNVDPENDVVFSSKGFHEVLVGGTIIWPQYKKVVGEAKEWPEPTKSINVGNKEFVLVKKMNASSQVFTLLKEDFYEFAKLQGWDNREDIEDIIAKEGLIKVVSDLGHDPKMLLSYLFLTTNLNPDLIHRIVRRTFEGLRGFSQENIDFRSFTQIEGGVDLDVIPEETDQPSILLEGKVIGAFEAIQVIGDRERVIQVKPDGTFRSRIILAAGEKGEFKLFPFHEENKTLGNAQIVRVQQTSEPKDLESMMVDLMQTKSDVIENIAKDKTRFAYLRKRLELRLLNHFTENESEGFAYLDRLIAGMPTDSGARSLYEGIRIRFEAITSIDKQGAEGFFIEGLNHHERLFFYQKYAIYEAMEGIKDYEENKNKPKNGNGADHMPAKVIALEQGLGKTVIALAIARSNKEDGSLVIAPNPVVNAWGEQEGHFFNEQRAVALKGSSKEKTQQLINADDDAIRVVNIEYLRSTEQDRLNALSKNTNQLLVLDESQAFSRAGSLQTQTAGQIKSRYTLLISATPFSSTQTARGLLRFITKQAGYEDSKVFSKYFLNDTDSLRLLHFLVDQYVIRIKKTDVFKTYDPTLPLEQQNNRLPLKKYIDPQEIGSYVISDAQAESIFDLFFNWNDWQAKKQELTDAHQAKHTQDDIERAKAGGELFFSRMHALRQLTNDPHYVGIDAPSPKHQKMDEIVGLEVGQKGGKVVIFASYKEQVKAYQERYAKYGAVSYYGDTLNDQINSRGNLVDKETREELLFRKINKFEYAVDEKGHLIADPKGDPISALDYNRYRFQFDPDVKVIIATYEAGSVGVTFTAADAVIFDDLARDYTVMYQAEDRANRIDNLRKKYQNRYYRLEARYPEKFLERLKGKFAVYTPNGVEIVNEGDAILDEAIKKDRKYLDLYQVFSRGTYDQIQGHNIMVNQKKIFELVLDGIESEEDLLQQSDLDLKDKMPMFFLSGDQDKDSKDAAMLQDMVMPYSQRIIIGRQHAIPNHIATINHNITESVRNPALANDFMRYIKATMEDPIVVKILEGYVEEKQYLTIHKNDIPAIGVELSVEEQAKALELIGRFRQFLLKYLSPDIVSKLMLYYFGPVSSLIEEGILQKNSIVPLDNNELMIKVHQAKAAIISILDRDLAFSKEGQLELEYLLSAREGELMQKPVSQGKIRDIAAKYPAHMQKSVIEGIRKAIENSDQFIYLNMRRDELFANSIAQMPAGSIAFIGKYHLPGVTELLRKKGLVFHAEVIGDAAMLTLTKQSEITPAKGGIDFNPAKLDLETKNTSDAIKLNLDPAMLKRLQDAPGFTPVIMDIQPMIDLPAFLGVTSATLP